jgi:hypothetical protein
MPERLQRQRAGVIHIVQRRDAEGRFDFGAEAWIESLGRARRSEARCTADRHFTGNFNHEVLQVLQVLQTNVLSGHGKRMRRPACPTHQARPGVRPLAIHVY